MTPCSNGSTENVASSTDPSKSTTLIVHHLLVPPFASARSVYVGGESIVDASFLIRLQILPRDPCLGEKRILLGESGVEAFFLLPLARFSQGGQLLSGPRAVQLVGRPAERKAVRVDL